MNLQTAQQRVNAGAAWITAGVAVAVLLALCVANKLNTVPLDIAERVSRALTESAFRVHDIDVDGRDVSVSGTVSATDAARIMAIVRSVRGVHSVRSNLTVVSSTRLDRTPSRGSGQGLRLARGTR